MSRFEIICFCITVIVLALAIIAVLGYRSRTKKLLNLVLQQIEAAISGTEQEAPYDESMDAAILERLNKLIQISKMNSVKAEKERNTVKALISDISHQIRTPLSNILLYAGILNEKELDKDSKEIVERILKQTEKLDFFMKELVRSSYLETDMISIAKQKDSVDELIQDACQQIEMKALHKEIFIDQAESGLVCAFDRKWTTEVLANILDNAIKYSPKKSHVHVSVIPYETFICVKVRDEGIGIEEKEHGLIFQRFYRSPKVFNEKGLGIGLYLARQIMIKQAGYIKVDSKLGEGTVFSVYLQRYSDM